MIKICYLSVYCPTEFYKFMSLHPSFELAKERNHLTCIMNLKGPVCLQ